MKVLVAVASRHGATREIGDAVADELREAAFDVDVLSPDEVESLDGYGGVVLGSAVYVGRWTASARAMVDRLAPGLTSRPLWLFSSGPVGTPPVPCEIPAELDAVLARLEPRDHRMFAGRLDLTRLNLAERAVVALLTAEEGDYRPWDEIRAWSQQVAADLHSEEIRSLRLVR